MSSALKLKSTAGGSVSLQVDDTLTTDETFNVSDGGIESGSNANGNWTKFPDGTLMCDFNSVAPTLTLTTSYGSIFYGDGIQWNFPYTFVGVPAVSVAPLSGSGAFLWVASRSASNLSSTLVGFQVMSPTSRASIVGSEWSWQAIGRWK